MPAKKKARKTTKKTLSWKESKADYEEAIALYRAAIIRAADERDTARKDADDWKRRHDALLLVAWSAAKAVEAKEE